MYNFIKSIKSSTITDLNIFEFTNIFEKIKKYIYISVINNDNVINTFNISIFKSLLDLKNADEKISGGNKQTKKQLKKQPKKQTKKQLKKQLKKKGGFFLYSYHDYNEYNFIIAFLQIQYILDSVHDFHKYPNVNNFIKKHFSNYDTIIDNYNVFISDEEKKMLKNFYTGKSVDEGNIFSTMLTKYNTITTNKKVCNILKISLNTQNLNNELGTIKLILPDINNTIMFSDMTPGINKDKNIIIADNIKTYENLFNKWTQKFYSLEQIYDPAPFSYTESVNIFTMLGIFMLVSVSGKNSILFHRTDVTDARFGATGISAFNSPTYSLYCVFVPAYMTWSSDGLATRSQYVISVFDSQRIQDTVIT